MLPLTIFLFPVVLFTIYAIKLDGVKCWISDEQKYCTDIPSGNEGEKDVAEIWRVWFIAFACYYGLQTVMGMIFYTILSCFF